MRLLTEAQRLRAALQPLASYAKNSRGKLDLSDPKAAARFRFVGDVEAALTAVADYYEAADKILNPPPSPLAQRVLAHLNQPHMQERLNYPAETREALASITAHHLPRPAFPNEPT